MSARRLLPRLLLALCVTVPSTEAAGQARTAVVRGKVVATTGDAVPRAEVMVPGTSARAAADDSGYFSLRVDGKLPGEHPLAARALGFRPVYFALQLSSGDDVVMEIVLERQPVELAATTVTERKGSVLMAGFWERKELGQGTFITREELSRQSSPSSVELLRMVPGFRFQAASGMDLRGRVTFDRCSHVSLYLDGTPALGPPGEVLPMINPQHIEAIEVYTGVGQLPADFRGGGNCAAIVVWTRVR